MSQVGEQSKVEQQPSFPFRLAVEKETCIEVKSSLECLPVLPLKMIFDGLKRRDLKALRQTSTTMRSLLENVKKFPQTFWMFDCDHQDDLERFSKEVNQIQELRVLVQPNEQFAKALKSLLDKHEEFNVLHLHINWVEDAHDNIDDDDENDEYEEDADDNSDEVVDSIIDIFNICKHVLKSLYISAEYLPPSITVSLPHLEDLQLTCGNSESLENLLELCSQTLTRLSWKFSHSFFNYIDIVIPRLDNLKYLRIEDCCRAQQTIAKFLWNCSSTLAELYIINVDLTQEVIPDVTTNLDRIYLEKCDITEDLLFSILKTCESSVTLLKLCKLTVSAAESRLPEVNLSQLKLLQICCIEDWTDDIYNSVLSCCGANIDCLHIMISSFTGKNMHKSSFCPRKLKRIVWRIQPNNTHNIELMEMLSRMPNLEEFELFIGDDLFSLGESTKDVVLPKLVEFVIFGCNALPETIFIDLFSAMPNLQKLILLGFTPVSRVSLFQASRIFMSKTKMEHLIISRLRISATILNTQVDEILSLAPKLKSLEVPDPAEISRQNLVKAEQLGVKILKSD